jgi:hypothetical protein
LPTSSCVANQASHRGLKVNGSILANSMRIAGSSVIGEQCGDGHGQVLGEASGRNSRPSWSTSVKTGMNATAITSSEKKTPGPTSSSASSRTWWKSPFLPP